jgi:biofilm protein TabA
MIMKYNSNLSKLTLSGLFILLLSAGTIYAQNDASSWSMKQARKWSNQREWANGFTATPDKTTNYKEFATQYQKNKEVWDKTFKWLATHDLQNMPAGKYDVAGTHCFINVQDAETQPVAQRKVEAHKHTIDLQYVVKGTERFGITSEKYSTATTVYKPDVTNYNSTKIKYVNSKPGRFFMFFPCNYHQAMVQAGKKSEKVRVIVAKIEYLQ